MNEDEMQAAFEQAMASESIPEAPKKLSRCGKPRLIPVFPRLGFYVVAEYCQRSAEHGGRCCVYWKS